MTDLFQNPRSLVSIKSQRWRQQSHTWWETRFVNGWTHNTTLSTCQFWTRTKIGWFRNQRHCIGDRRRLFNIHSSQLYSYQANVKGRGSPRPTNLPSPGARGLENQTKYCSCLQKASFSGPTNFKLPITPTMSRYC